jgi:hypothetical protein
LFKRVPMRGQSRSRGDRGSPTASAQGSSALSDEVCESTARKNKIMKISNRLFLRISHRNNDREWLWRVRGKKSLNLDVRKEIIAAAVDYAKKNNAPGAVIAVVDDGGNLMALQRLDGTFAAGANISIGKARTAVL